MNAPATLATLIEVTIAGGRDGDAFADFDVDHGDACPLPETVEEGDALTYTAAAELVPAEVAIAEGIAARASLGAAPEGATAAPGWLVKRFKKAKPPKPHYGATPAEWEHFERLGFADDLMPVVSNPHAAKSPGSGLKKLGKVPSIYNGSGEVIGYPGWSSATFTKSDRAKWRRNSDLGICVRTSTVRAFDVDIEDAELAKKARDIIDGKTGGLLPVRTRGNSRKFLAAFRMPGTWSKAFIGTAAGRIEFLANGQQFVAIGTHPSGERYAWEGGLPSAIPELTPETFAAIWDALAKECGDGAQSQPSSTAAKAERAPALEGVDRNAARERFTHYLQHEAPLAVEGQGGDDSTFRVAAAGKDRGVTESEAVELMLAHWNERCTPPWTADELQQKVRNAFAYGREPAGIRAPEAVFPPLTEEERTAAEAVKPNEQKAAKPRFVSIGEALAAVRPIDWLVEDWVESQGLCMLWGESETWKSFIAVAWILCVATGTPWHGRKVKQGPVVYFCGEGHRGIARRAAAWAAHNGVDLADVPLLISRGSTNVRQQEVIDAVSEAVRIFGRNPALIVVDTLHRNFGGGDENSSQDVGTMLEVLDRNIAQPLQCTVVLVHHANKDGATFRGSSSLRNSMDFEFSTSRAGDLVTLTPEKMKDAEKPEPITFASSVVHLTFGHGMDSSLVLEPTTARAPGRKPKKLRAVVAEVLMGLSAGGEWVDVKALRQAVVAACSEAGAPEPSRQNLNRELGALEDSGWLTRSPGKVRMNPPAEGEGGVVNAVVSGVVSGS